MILYPLIELLGGRCVSLFRGNLDEPQIWHVDPIEKARSFAAAGAEYLHITDFDAMAGDDRNAELVQDIIRAVGIPVHLGGGIRTMDRISELLDRGVARTVIGTMAVSNPDFVKEAAKFHPDQILLAVDVYQGKVVSDGWRESSTFEPDGFIEAFQIMQDAALEGHAEVELYTPYVEVPKSAIVTDGVKHGTR